jgi:hypothetical protein
MAGAGFKDFTAGDILTAAQVDEYLMQQTVMRFANAAARTTALSGVLAEGMLSYLDDTNKVQVYNGSSWVDVGGSSPLTTKGDLYTYSTSDTRLGVGTNGQYLSANSSTATGLEWVTPSSGGAYTLLSTVTLSGASTTLSNISQDYTNLLLVGRGIYGSTSGNFGININNGTDTWQTAGYHGTIAGFTQTEWKISADRSVDTSGGLPLAFTGMIYNYTSTNSYKPVMSFGYNYTGSTQESCWTMGGYRNTSAVTSLVFDASGNGTGTILVYGVK